MIQFEFEELKARGHRHSSLAIHPYFGKVDPAIVRAALTNLSQPLQTVLDPFCGSGTVVHDALLSQRSVIGFDSSPLACLIATAKVLGITKEEEQQFRFITGEIFDERGLFNSKEEQIEEIQAMIPDMPRVRAINDWFGPNTLNALARIKLLIENSRSKASDELQFFLKVAFSRIITQASYQKGESTYSRIEKEDSANRVNNLFKRSVEAVLKAAKAFNVELRDSGLPPPMSGRLAMLSDGRIIVNHGPVRAVIVNSDSRKVQGFEKKAMGYDLIVTSPPYLMSWDYGLYHKFRFYWLDFDLDFYEETEIGRHLRRQKDDVERYKTDMTGVFASLLPFANPQAHAVLVNAPSVVYGELVDTNALLCECATSTGWHHLGSTASVAIPGPHHGMYASLQARSAVAPGSAGKREHVLLFRV